MKGLELSRAFYEEFGKNMISEQFSDVADRIAVGLVGEGSECLGFDDNISTDHDFEPGFCLFITAEDERRFGFRLERAYSKLPKEFMGFCRQPLSPVGGNRHGVLVIEDFYQKFLGAPSAPDTIERWLFTPSATLRTASNDEVWRDDLGIFSEIRSKLLMGYPEEIRRKRIAAHTLMMAQSGQYNLPRCLDRGDLGAAQLCIAEFVKSAISTVYLLNNVYEPFYKWAYRGMRELPLLSDMADKLPCLFTAEKPTELIENIANELCDAFCQIGLSNHTDNDLSVHAYKISNTVKDGTLRNMHILEGI